MVETDLSGHGTGLESAEFLMQSRGGSSVQLTLRQNHDRKRKFLLLLFKWAYLDQHRTVHWGETGPLEMENFREISNGQDGTRQQCPTFYIRN